MAHDHDDLLGLLAIGRTLNPKEQRMLWRRGMARLADLSATRPVPLEGLDPLALEESTKIAIDRGFVDHLEWLSGSQLALFGLMCSLPTGTERRLLGRRVLQALLRGNAHSFATLATTLATSFPKVLGGTNVRARVALCLQLPARYLDAVDSLALELISHPDLVQEYLVRPSIGSLPDRRMAARLLERAARQALRNSQYGDNIGRQVFSSAAVHNTWERLLWDRESLTWRHVASARGALIGLIPELGNELARELQELGQGTGLHVSLTSLSASIAIHPERALVACRDILRTELVRQDPSVVQSLLFGLVTASCFEPEAAKELLVACSEVANCDSYEALLDIQSEGVTPGFPLQTVGKNAPPTDSASNLLWCDAVLAKLAGTPASVQPHRKSARKPLIKQGRTRTGAQCTLVHEHRKRSDNAVLSTDRGPWVVGLHEQLRTPTLGLHSQISLALDRFNSGGPDAAKDATEDALEHVSKTVDALCATQAANGQEDVRSQFRLLRELDRVLFETDALNNLTLVTQLSGDQANPSAPLEQQRQRLHDWLLAVEGKTLDTSDVVHPVFRKARLRALIHLVDSDPGDGGRTRRSKTVTAFLRRMEFDHPSELERMTTVTLARACDASLRDGSFELSDLILAVLPVVMKRNALGIFAEASLLADVQAIAAAFDSVGKATYAEDLLDAVEALVSQFPWPGRPRLEALRLALSQTAMCLRDLLVERTEDSLLLLAHRCQWLAQLTFGARRRLGLSDPEFAPFSETVLRGLAHSLGADCQDIGTETAACIAVLKEELPAGISDTVVATIDGLTRSPDSETPRASEPTRARRKSKDPIIGSQRVAGFVLLQEVGDGGAGSVFLACREQDEHAKDPELFALKRPRYSGQHAQVLSEEEFFDLFRQEAGTLLSLPPHTNLAGFVTCDLRAKPDPVLVMEYIEGPSLARLLESNRCDLFRAFRLLDGIASGLEVMHAQDVGHLDIKPENIIVRGEVPVLVDFGLAGRKYRPGCATVHYGAPEVIVGDARGPAVPADVYSFACLAFELLTGAPLFRFETLQGFVEAHFSHDGLPAPLASLRKNPRLEGLAHALRRCLRQTPAERASIGRIRTDLRECEQDRLLCEALLQYRSR